MESRKRKNEVNESRISAVRPWKVAVLMLISGAVAVALTLVVLLSGVTQYGISDRESEYSTVLIEKLLKDIDQYYYFGDERPTNKELVEKAAHTLISSLGDPYSTYYTYEEYESFRNDMNGNYKGVGILVSVSEDGMEHIVSRSYIANAAYVAGVRDFDRIIKVDDKSTAGLDVNALTELLTGEDGTTVKLTIERDGLEMEFSIVRGDVNLQHVFSEILENDIGYICIESFTGNAAEEFNNHLQTLLDANIKSLIIDVRNNPGGSLDTVVKICDRILPKCDITTLEGKNVNPPETYSSTDEQSINLPLVVLANANSASASELFAGAVQDNHAGTIIGTVTYGKGIVQTSWSLGTGLGYIKLTTDAYRTPSGKLIHGIGIMPDVEVEQAEELEYVDPYFTMRDSRESDLQLAAAIEHLLNNN